MKENNKQTALAEQAEGMEERRFVVEVARVRTNAANSLPSPALRNETGMPVNGINIGALCQPLTAAALLDGFCRFYAMHPPVFSPVGLKFENPGTRDRAALRIYLRLTS